MNEFYEYGFQKPAMLDRSPQSLEKAAQLRSQGCLTGVICCLHCFVLSNWFCDGAWRALEPRHWIMFQCPACGKYGCIFLHDYECLESVNQNPKETNDREGAIV